MLLVDMFFFCFIDLKCVVFDFFIFYCKLMFKIFIIIFLNLIFGYIVELYLFLGFLEYVLV